MAAAPAMWGLDMEVPWMDWKSSPGRPPLMSEGMGVCPARICTPGAVMSGLLTPRVWPGPPRELKAAITSGWTRVASPWVKVPITPVWLSMKSRSSWPLSASRCTLGMKWLSVARPCMTGL